MTEHFSVHVTSPIVAGDPWVAVANSGPGRASRIATAQTFDGIAREVNAMVIEAGQATDMPPPVPCGAASVVLDFPSGKLRGGCGDHDDG